MERPLSLNIEDIMQNELENQSRNENESSAEFQENDFDTQQSRKKHLILFILAVIFVVVGGSLALFRYIQRMAVQAPSSPPQAADASIVRPSREVLNESFRLKPFRITLTGPYTHYAQLEIVIEHRNDPSLKKEVLRREAQLRDIILFIIQKKTREFLLSPDGKEALRKEIRTAINRVMRRKIDEVHITELMIL